LLDRFLKGNAHSRRAQLRAGFNAYKKASGLEKLPCTLCKDEKKKSEYRDSAAWLKHIGKHHLEELWEDAEDEGDDENEEDEYDD
jgi:hypothetical protein